MARDPLPPVLLGELRAASIPIFCCCPICHNKADLDPATITMPDGADMKRVSNALLCKCGRKGGIDASPKPIPWVLHLRATGQNTRLPWYAPFIWPDDDKG